MLERGSAVLQARMASRAGHYDEMIEAMRKIVFLHVELTTEEKKLFATAYKMSFDFRRQLLAYLSRHIRESPMDAEHMEMALAIYRGTMNKLRNICEDVVYDLNIHLIQNAATRVSEAYYHKIKGDFYRYLSEITVGSEHQDAKRNAAIAYSTSMELAFSFQEAKDILKGSLSGLVQMVFANEQRLDDFGPNIHQRQLVTLLEDFSNFVAQELAGVKGYLTSNKSTMKITACDTTMNAVMK